MKISIITLTYGHENYIKQAIESVLMQIGDFDMEFIIANDNSPDNTDTIIRNIITTDSKAASMIQYTKHSTNLGAIANFIWALKQCQGEYIALCEGDDYWTDPYKLQKQVDFLEANNDYVLTHHDTAVVDENNNLLKESKLPLLYRKDFSNAELQKGISLPTLTLFFRNVFFENPVKFPNVVNGDYVLVSLLGLYGKAKYISDIQKACYRVHTGGVWSKTSKIKKNDAKYSTLKGMSEFYFNIGNKELALHFRS